MTATSPTQAGQAENFDDFEIVAPEDSLVVAVQAIRRSAAVRRRFRSTLKGLIFRTFRVAAVRTSRNRVEDLAGASGTSSAECLRGTGARAGLSRGPISSTK